MIPVGIIPCLVAAWTPAADSATPSPSRPSRTAKALPVEEDAVTGLSFVRLPKGCFKMGSPSPVHPKEDFHWPHLGVTAPIDADERPVHQVCVSRLWIGKTEVTAAAWERVFGAPPPFGRGDEPAGGISWVQVQGFLAKLNSAAGRIRYRLPTEAEWEYACRAGKARQAERSDIIVIEGAWYAHSWLYRGSAQPVGRLPPNAWGLFDMLGNVWEWTADMYRKDAYRRHVLYDPREEGDRGAPDPERVIRGASFRSEYLQVRCAARSHFGAAESLPQIGFRLVRIE